MATDLEMALMAYEAYRPNNNNTLLPSGWTFLEALSPMNWGGFGASVFKRGIDEVVIAFRGTDPVLSPVQKMTDEAAGER